VRSVPHEDCTTRRPSCGNSSTRIPVVPAPSGHRALGPIMHPCTMLAASRPTLGYAHRVPGWEEKLMSTADQFLPLVGVLLGSAGTYAATRLNERKRARQDQEREWRLRRSQSYLAFLVAVKKMRLIAQQMAATLGLDEEGDPIDLADGVRKLVAADNDRGTAYEHVNVYGRREAILTARALNRTVWGLEWIARERHPSPTPELWAERNHAYASAVDDYIEAIRLDLGVEGDYPRREIEYPHAAEQRPKPERLYRRTKRQP
jgi:hypothetical protein